MHSPKQALLKKRLLSRRGFIHHAAVGTAAFPLWSKAAGSEPLTPALAEVVTKLDPYFTPQEKFRDVSRGKPLPHSLSEEKKRTVGLTRETWKLEVSSDPEKPAKLRRSFTSKDGTALDFAGL